MSLLRRLRHLHDFPELVHVEHGFDKWWEKSPKEERIFEDRFRRLHAARRRVEATVPEELRAYVNGNQHDATILNHSREGDRFKLTSTDMSIAMLAGYGFGVPWPNCLFPFDLIFEGVTYVGWRSVDKGEGLSWMPPLAVSENEPSTWWMDTFLEPEQIGVRWALLFRHTYRNRYSRGMLLVEAVSMRVVERQRPAWVDRVGSLSLPIFDEYQAQRNENTLTVFEYREKYFRERGLPCLNPFSDN